ncbi:MAG: hypothetical protein KDB01_21250, partial [Planctomycetaceae bacterium]|nr:hypothetical protein [Planctomycetaceae bacterium]
METFRQLRADDKFDDAIKMLIQSCQSTNEKRRHKVLRTEIFGSRCLILDWAATMVAKGQRADCEATLQEIRRHVLPLTDASQDLMESRLRLIEAMTCHEGEASNVREAIEFTVQKVTDAWKYQAHFGVTDAQHADLEP